MLRGIVLLSLIILSNMSLADDISVLPEALESCSVCHGTQLMGNENTGAPRLSQLPGWYVENQIAAFKNEWRGKHADDHSGAEMMPTAKMLSPEVIALAVNFIEKSSSIAPSSEVLGDIDNGRKIYAQCALCHGQQAQGNKTLSAPPLAGLNDWYIVKQLKNFKDSVRGSASGYTNGQIMMASAQVLKDENAMIDVAFYISQINSDKENK